MDDDDENLVDWGYDDDVEEVIEASGPIEEDEEDILASDGEAPAPAKPDPSPQPGQYLVPKFLHFSTLRFSLCMLDFVSELHEEYWTLRLPSKSVPDATFSPSL